MKPVDHFSISVLIYVPSMSDVFTTGSPLRSDSSPAPRLFTSHCPPRLANDFLVFLSTSVFGFNWYCLSLNSYFTLASDFKLPTFCFVPLTSVHVAR